ncbi:MAG: transposase DNA-binding-containing protein, partial [Bacteroidales bacterium]
MKQSYINFNQQFSSKRLENRANRFIKAVIKHQSVSINKVSGKWSEAMGNYRMLENKKVTVPAIKAAITGSCGQNCGHVLCIQDTTQPNYEKHRGRIKPKSGLGLIGDNKSL